MKRDCIIKARKKREMREKIEKDRKNLTSSEPTSEYTTVIADPSGTTLSVF
jgi:hypothetical protein